MRSITGFIFFALLSFGVRAAPISYDEMIDGDLVGGLATQTFYLGEGQNIVSGSLSITQSINDSDPFNFVVEQGYEVTNITFSYQSDFTGGYAAYHFYLDEDGDGIDFERVVVTDNNSNTVDFFSDLMNLESGRYSLGRSGIGYTAGFNYFTSYTYNIDVVEVVEPPSFILMILPLFFLIGKRLKEC